VDSHPTGNPQTYGPIRRWVLLGRVEYVVELFKIDRTTRVTAGPNLRAGRGAQANKVGK
jgi:hypothetical protein